MESGERGVHRGRGRRQPGGAGDQLRGDQGAGDRCGFEEGQELENGAGEGVAVPVELVQGEVPGVPDDTAGGLRVAGRAGVLGAQQIGELGLQGVLVGGERPVPARGHRQISARRFQPEGEPAEPDGQGLGLVPGSGVRRGIQKNRPARLIGQRLKMQQIGVRPPGLPTGVPARHQQNPAPVRTQPPPVGRRQPRLRADTRRGVHVVDHDQPPPHPRQVLPDGVDERHPARTGLLQPGLGQPQDVRGLGEILSELLRIVTPPDPQHHPPLSPGLCRGLSGEGCLPQPPGPAHHHHAPARSPHQGADSLQLCLPPPYRCRDRRRVHRMP